MQRRFASSRWATLLGWAIGLAALAALLVQVREEGPVLGRVLAPGLSLLWMVIPYAFATSLYAIPWALLLTSAARPSWRATLGSRFAAAAINAVLPSGLAGEPIRLRPVDRAQRVRAGEALVWDRALFLGANGLYLSIAAAVAWWSGAARAFSIAGAIAALVHFWVAASVVGVTRLGPLRRAIGRRLSRRDARAIAVEAVLGAALTPPWRTVVGGLFVHLVARLIAASEIWLAVGLAGASLDAYGWLVASSAVAIAGTALPIVPGQIGVQEAALTGALSALGISPAIGLAASLLIRVRQLCFVPLGLALAISPITAPPVREPLRGS